MDSLLVTGGAGFIGANFVHYWLGQHPQDTVVVLDALTYAGNLSSLASAWGSSRLRFMKGDIRTPGLVEKLLREHACGTIVHFAAESHVDRSISGPDAFIETNILGTHEVLKAARTCGVRLHHVSTDEVFGSLSPNDSPSDERTRYAPNSPYAASKAAADHLVRAYQNTYGVAVTVSNCSNNYGPYQFPEKLIPLMLVNALEGRPLPVYGDGLNVRDWLFVEDHCRALDCVLRRGRLGETYNIGGGNEWRNIDIVRLLCRLVDEAFSADSRLGQRFPKAPAAGRHETASLITFVADRPGHDRRYSLDARKIERDLGFSPAESFESGIRKTVGWYLANEVWWRAIMDGSYRNADRLP